MAADAGLQPSKPGVASAAFGCIAIVAEQGRRRIMARSKPWGAAMAGIVLWHNPRCSKSREALALLRGRGVEPVLRPYLEDPPDRAELEAALEALAMSPRELLRRDEAAYAAAGLDDPGLDRAALVAAMVAQPILIQRPIALSGGRAVVGRPPARVLDLLA